MDAQTAGQIGSVPKESRFSIRQALWVGACFAMLAFLAIQLVGAAAGVAFGIRTVAGIHFSVAIAIVSGVATVTFTADDEGEEEVTGLPTRRPPRSRYGPQSAARRAAQPAIVGPNYSRVTEGGSIHAESRV